MKEQGLTEWVREQVGQQHIDFVTAFAIQHLGTPITADEIRYRVAPSIMARSECELYSISAPRFAVRASLPDGSFLNLRRIEFLLRACANVPIAGTSGKRSLADELMPNRTQGTAIGDSVIVPPKNRFDPHEWFVLTAPLGKRYGEHAGILEGEIHGTPYVRQMYLGGGMCAQAACFMANALLIEDANALFGVAEITALASEAVCQGRPASLTVTGMTLGEMQLFLSGNFVGLECYIQAPYAIAGAEAPLGDDSHLLLELCVNALRSYVLSGMPIILHLDYRNVCFAEDFAPQSDCLAQLTDPAHHAMVFVGCELKRPCGFVVNDPSYLPFRQLAPAELRGAIPVTDRGKTPRFAAVTPPGVKLPLFPSFSRRSPATFGMTDVLAGLACSDDEDRAALFPENFPIFQPDDEMRLLRVDGQSHEWMITLCRGDSVDPGVVQRLNDWLSTVDGRCMTWLWSIHRRFATDHRIAEWFLIVDAGTALAPGSTMSVHGRLAALAIIKWRTTQNWEVRHLNHKAIKPSAISSFSTQQSSMLGKHLPSLSDQPTICAVEWYALMQSEIETAPMRRIAKRHGKPCATAFEFMAACGDPANAAMKDEAIARLLNVAPKDRPVIALSTFIPSLSSLPTSVEATEGVRAYVSSQSSRLPCASSNAIEAKK